MQKIEAVVKVKTDKETADLILGLLNMLRGNVTAVIGEKFNELVAQAEEDKRKWFDAIGDSEKLTGEIPLNPDRAKMVVAALSRLPKDRVDSYVDDMYNHSDGWSLHFAQENDVWEITSATKVKDLTLVDFIRNFRSMVEFSYNSGLPMNKFNQLCQKMFDNYKYDHPDQFPKAN